MLGTMFNRYPIIFVAITALLGSGCSDSGFGRFDGNVVAGPDCVSDFMPFDTVFQTAQPKQNSLMLFFQSDGGTPAGKDFIHLAALEPDELELGTTYSLDLPLSEDAAWVGQVSLAERCPEEPLSLYLLGDIRLDDYDTTNGSRVAGSFENGTIYEAENDTPFVEDVSGSWDFTLTTGPPYEPFP